MSAEAGTAAERVLPCLVLIEGSLGSGVLIPGVTYRVAEVREHWEPTGVEGEQPHVSTVVRFDPADPGLREALVALGPGTVADMAWSHHKWEWRADLDYYSVVEDADGRPVPDDAPMASLAAALRAVPA